MRCLNSVKANLFSSYDKLNNTVTLKLGNVLRTTLQECVMQVFFVYRISQNATAGQTAAIKVNAAFGIISSGTNFQLNHVHTVTAITATSSVTTVFISIHITHNT
jgi:hypothetical protein